MLATQIELPPVEMSMPCQTLQRKKMRWHRINQTYMVTGDMSDGPHNGVSRNRDETGEHFPGGFSILTPGSDFGKRAQEDHEVDRELLGPPKQQPSF